MAAAFQRISERPAAAQRRHRRRADRAGAVRRPPRRRPSATRAPTSSSRSCAAPGPRGRSTSTASTTRSRAPQVRGTIDPLPDIYFGGSSAPAGPVAAKHADVYLTWGEPLEQVEEKLDWIRGLAKEQGRDIRFGLRIHTLSRDTSERAWQEAQWLLDGLDPATIEKAQEALAASESTGQQRMRALHGGRAVVRRRPTTSRSRPNLWSGVGLVRGGAGTALVGSHQEVADRLEEYHRIGIDEFILSGYPHVEEAYWFAEGVKPILRAKGILGDDVQPGRRLASA